MAVAREIKEGIYREVAENTDATERKERTGKPRPYKFFRSRSVVRWW
jgi:hypothetical protein